jgi:hypothetical protein
VLVASTFCRWTQLGPKGVRRYLRNTHTKRCCRRPNTFGALITAANPSQHALISRCDHHHHGGLRAHGGQIWNGRAGGCDGVVRGAPIQHAGRPHESGESGCLVVRVAVLGARWAWHAFPRVAGLCSGTRRSANDCLALDCHAREAFAVLGQMTCGGCSAVPSPPTPSSTKKLCAPRRLS